MTPAAPARGRGRLPTLHPGVVLSVALLALSAVLGSVGLTWQVPLGGQTWLPWWAVALLVAACEAVVLHLQVRSEAQLVSLSELAIVVALFFAAPVAMLVGRLVGSAAVFVGWRRQSGIKVLFNCSLSVAETTIALLVFHALAGDGQMTSRAWLAAAAACAAVGCLAGLTVTAVVGLTDGGVTARDLATEAGLASLTSVAAAQPALIAVLALGSDRLAAVPLAVVFVLLLLGYRAYSRLSERHETLGGLYRFTEAMGASSGFEQVLTTTLEQARELLHAEKAEIVLTDPSVPGAPERVRLDQAGVLRRERLPVDQLHDPLWREVLADRGQLLLPRGGRDEARRAFLQDHELRDAVVVPLVAESDVVGAILVGDRLGEVRTFDDEDARLLQTIADHTGIAVQNGLLVDRLRHEALHDGLTGLPNRTLLNRQLADLAEDVRAGRLAGLAVVILDLVDFKEVNDTFGHHVGDLVLCEVGNRLAGGTPRGGLVARLGGDEFAVLLPGIERPDDARAAGRRLRAALAQPIRVEGTTSIQVSASIGMCLAPRDGDLARTLLTRADAAMYEAKSTGTGLGVYEAGLERSVDPERLALAGELRRAIAADELEVHVQPIATLPNRRVVGVEALVRWRHPRLGLLQPEAFIGLAERTGLISTLTTTVLTCAIEQCGRWQRAGHPLSVAVNLSARGILDDGLTETVARLLAEHDVPADDLTLEITESAVVGRPARASAVLRRLRELGVRLSLDDFGTGYSSLSYLRELPVQALKIDKSFVARMTVQDSDATIVRSIIDLAGNLGLEVVAEGVEDRATWDRLAALGCDLVQGYYLAPPMTPSAFETWVAARDTATVPGIGGGRAARPAAGHDRSLTSSAGTRARRAR